jgi:hypothetical protein
MQTRHSRLKGISLRVPFRLLALSGALIVGATTASAQVDSPDVDGSWAWQERAVLVLPGPAAQFAFQIPESEGPVMRIYCESEGLLTISQSGDTFTGTATQSSSCRTQGGQAVGVVPFPPGFEFSGSISGQSIRINTADLILGISCDYRGSLQVDGGLAITLKAAGNCDSPFPFKPNTDHNTLAAWRL